MEPKGFGRWKSRVPEIICSQGMTNPLVRPLTPATCGETTGHRKTVTMAPVSRYMNGRSRYSVRKPLATPERQSSILKKSLPQVHSEPQMKANSAEADAHTRRAQQKSSASPHLIQADSLSLSAPLTSFDLRTFSQEEPDSSSSFLGVESGRRSLFGLPLEVHTPVSLRSPRWTSTILSSPTPCSPSFRVPTRGRMENRDCPLAPRSALLYRKSLSPNQANYWACALPPSMPPSPDRSSPGWDPDWEYQALLDYTYPVRPGHASSECGPSEPSSTLLRSDPVLQDSGIGLDRFCSSSSLSCVDQVLGELGRAKKSVVKGQRSALREHSIGRLSSSPYSSVEQMGQSLESLGQSLEPMGQSMETLGQSGEPMGQSKESLVQSVEPMSQSEESVDCEERPSQRWCNSRKLSVFSSQGPQFAASFIRSTLVLPRPGTLGDWDEEFHPLPGHLLELQVLSRQVRDLSAQVSMTVSASWDSLERETTSVRSTTTLGVRQAQEGPFSEATRSREVWEGLKGLGSRMERLTMEVKTGGLKEAESILAQLGGASPYHGRELNQGSEESESRDSLKQHIELFCTNLEQLIQWLYTVVEKVEVLSPPTVDIESVKSSLADYKSFQKEVSDHQPLTLSVLQTGEILLSCMNSTSPILKEALGLIQKQSRALETHAEYLFSSILSAMDSLTEPGTGRTHTQQVDEHAYRVPEENLAPPPHQQCGLGEQGGGAEI